MLSVKLSSCGRWEVNELGVQKGQIRPAIMAVLFFYRFFSPSLNVFFAVTYVTLSLLCAL